MWGLVCCALGQYTGAGHGQLPPVELPSRHSEGEGWIYADVQLMLLTYSVWKEDYMYGILIRNFFIMLGASDARGSAPLLRRCSSFVDPRAWVELLW